MLCVFIAEGNKVKATIMFRGRELSHPEMGKELLLKVAEAMQDAVYCLNANLNLKVKI